MVDQMLNDRPIFIVGAQRSGTTLLRYILSSHPRIYIPPESNFIPRYFGSHPKGILSRGQAIKTVAGILDYRMFFKDWGTDRPDPEQLVDSLNTITPATILDAIYGQYAALHGSERWGDKSPIYSDYVDLLVEIYPKAQFIHIIRDGRDVALSMLNSYQSPRFFYVDLYYAAKEWKQRVNNARRSGQRLAKGNYYELHYENLTANPIEEIEMICDYLEEELEPGMAEPHSTANSSHHSKGIHSGTRKPLNTESVGKWKSRMPEQDQRLFQSVAGDLLIELGYEVPDLGVKSIADTVRLAELRSKYQIIQFGKQLTRSAGVFHPTNLLSRYLDPYPNKNT